MTIAKILRIATTAIILMPCARVYATESMPDPDCEIMARMIVNTNLSTNERLISAAAAGNLGNILESLEAGAAINYSDNELGTPLAWASRCGNLNAVEYLVSHGADINLRVTYQKGMQYRFRNSSALIWATSNGNVDVIRYLLTQGANPNQREEVYKLSVDGGEQLVSAGRAAVDVTNDDVILEILRR